MSFCVFILRVLGLNPTKEDVKLKQLVDNTYQSVSVVDRGTIRIDPTEVAATQEFKNARKKAKALFEET